MKKAIVFPLIFLLGAGTAFLIVPMIGRAPQEPVVALSSKGDEIWTCSMHPQVRRPNPGNCPICGMPLILAGEGAKASASGAPVLQLSERARAMASVETTPVARRELFKEIRSVGKIQYNETGLATVVTRVDGFIEKLFVDSAGVNVSKGDHLVEIYSQDLAVAQSELLISRDYATAAGNLAESIKGKMRQWGVSDEEIEKVLKTGKVLPRLTLYAPMSGTVTEKKVVEGSFVNRGDALYRLANLDSVWINLDIYEYELVWIQPGQLVDVVAEAYSGDSFQGRVSFIAPTLNEDSRTVKVRVILSNKDGRLKPGMFVHANIRVQLLSSGQPAPTGVEGKWTCPMHPEVLAEKGGACPICGMKLAQIPLAPKNVDPYETHVLAVPVSAVLDSGTRKLVYVEKARGQFVQAEVVLGPRAGEFYPIISGLKEGDNVAVRGNFLIDSQFQIRGMSSLFQPAGGSAPDGQSNPGVPPASPGHKH